MQLLNGVKVGDSVWTYKLNGDVVQCTVKSQETKCLFYGVDYDGNKHLLSDLCCFDNQKDALVESIESLEFKIFQNRELLSKL